MKVRKDQEMERKKERGEKREFLIEMKWFLVWSEKDTMY